MFENPTWGMRLMPWDLPALALCAGATWWLWPHIGSLALLCPMVFGHFLLFCNVFRVRRSFELAWSASFLINCAASLAAFDLDAMATIAAVQLPFTALAIGAEARSWRYHGVAADRLNPELERYVEWAQARHEPS